MSISGVQHSYITNLPGFNVSDTTMDLSTSSSVTQETEVSYINRYGFLSLLIFFLVIFNVLSSPQPLSSSGYSPFSDRVGLHLHNIPSSGVLMKSIGAEFFDRMPFLASNICVGCSIK